MCYYRYITYYTDKNITIWYIMQENFLKNKPVLYCKTWGGNVFMKVEFKKLWSLQLKETSSVLYLAFTLMVVTVDYI